ncbi:hypothetical protein MmiEs2_14280 [Methanimicrococcus stummii]|uniref:DUF2953 domain-containing protein n=1 Tax=Methanimicrococcus stummii TaxID=3028294 RepID=A0AA96V9T2_9EURY|nr:DUF2953 domain-containing protein [Methanimicrococcus sp. Es2]WNY29204.1 hypothetical protein MmiEs2_14280 [Methanimicrococcus sp. Es2]
MTLQTVLASAGHYLLIAAGLILLLFIIVLAAAFLLTLLMRLFANFSFKTVDGKIQSQILIRLKIWFYEIILLDFDNFDENAAPSSDSDSESGADKNAYHVTFTDEKVSVRSVKTNENGSDYEIIVHTEEMFSKNIQVSDGDSQTTVFEAPDIVTETDDVLTLNEDEVKDLGIENEFGETTETVTTETITTEYEFDKNDWDSDSESDDEFEGDEVSNDEFDDNSDDESDGDLSDFLDEIKRYVDLSDPGRFVSDSITAAARISKSSARLASDLLLRADIDEMSADVVFGLSDPADTALAFGTIHSFKASTYAYLAEIEETSRSSKKRKKAAELGAIVRNDICIVPDLTNKMFETDTTMSFSFWIPRGYIPMLRFILNKNTRWTIRRYLYPYFIRHYIRNWLAERKQRKQDEKQRKQQEKQQKQ